MQIYTGVEEWRMSKDSDAVSSSVDFEMFIHAVGPFDVQPCKVLEMLNGKNLRMKHQICAFI